ncbi:EamA family transporter [Alphaproteobacteria bacterium]|nr:EamA family transporter [Alphaproteobacteria bacterium]
MTSSFLEFFIMSNALLYMITVLVWGTTWFAIKLQVDQAPAELSIPYRHALAGAFLVGFCFLKKIKLNIFNFRDHFFLVVLGISMFSAHYIFIYAATNHIASGMVAVVFSTVSFFNILYGILFFKSIPSLNVIAGVLLGVLGIGIFFSPVLMNSALQAKEINGIVLAGIGALIFSIGSVVTRRNQSRGLDTLPCMTMATLYGTLFILIYGLIRNVQFEISSDFTYWSSLLYLAVFGTVIAFFCYLKLIRNIGGALAGYAAVLYPLVALVISSVFEGYAWDLSSFMGISLVLFGNVLVMWKKKHA